MTDGAPAGRTVRLLVAGNWKMNGLSRDLSQIEAVKAALPANPPVDVVLCPPVTLLDAALRLTAGSHLRIGVQDCHAAQAGAFTGDISAVMLKDAGADIVILGHSERRAFHGETSAVVKAKATSALQAGLKVILCIGETKGERHAGLTSDVCLRQLRESLPETATAHTTTIAYEPVWAIGQGVTPQLAEISGLHGELHKMLNGRSGAHPWRVLYGGSVTPANAAGIFATPAIDGVLVGGASLQSEPFLAIIHAALGSANVDRRSF